MNNSATLWTSSFCRHTFGWLQRCRYRE